MRHRQRRSSNCDRNCTDLAGSSSTGSETNRHNKSYALLVKETPLRLELIAYAIVVCGPAIMMMHHHDLVNVRLAPGACTCHRVVGLPFSSAARMALPGPSCMDPPWTQEWLP